MQGTVLQQNQTFDLRHMYAAYSCTLVHVLSISPNMVEGAHKG